MTLDQARLLALALPQVDEQPHFQRTSFRVRGKIFATAATDGGHLHVFVPEEVRAQALALHPDQVEKLYWGARVVGVRVAWGASEALVAELLRAAWLAKAPPTLRKTLQ